MGRSVEYGPSPNPNDPREKARYVLGTPEYEQRLGLQRALRLCGKEKKVSFSETVLPTIKKAWETMGGKAIDKEIFIALYDEILAYSGASMANGAGFEKVAEVAQKLVLYAYGDGSGKFKLADAIFRSGKAKEADLFEEVFPATEKILRPMNGQITPDKFQGLCEEVEGYCAIAENFGELAETVQDVVQKACQTPQTPQA